VEEEWRKRAAARRNWSLLTENVAIESKRKKKGDLTVPHHQHFPGPVLATPLSGGF